MALKISYNDAMCEIFREYLEVHGGCDSALLDDVYDWATRNAKWEPPRRTARNQFRQDMARSLSMERVEDPQGRKVRRNHAVRDSAGNGQRYFWADLFTATPAHMQKSLQQRRHRLVAMAIRHKNDTDSYNDNNIHGAQLEFDYNIQLDIEEHFQPSEYPDERPSDE